MKPDVYHDYGHKRSNTDKRRKKKERNIDELIVRSKTNPILFGLLQATGWIK